MAPSLTQSSPRARPDQCAVVFAASFLTSSAGPRLMTAFSIHFSPDLHLSATHYSAAERSQTGSLTLSDPQVKLGR